MNYFDDIDINNLHVQFEKREEIKYNTYNEMLQKIKRRIINTNEQLRRCHCTYKFQKYVLGVPLYDMAHCINYIIKKLREKGFFVSQVDRDTIYIDWYKKPEKKQMTPNKYDIFTKIPVLDDIKPLYSPYDKNSHWK